MSSFFYQLPRLHLYFIHHISLWKYLSPYLNYDILSEIKISQVVSSWNEIPTNIFHQTFPPNFPFFFSLLIYLLIYLTYPYFHYIFLRIYIFPTKFHSFFQKGQKFPSPSIFVRTCAPRLIRNDTRVTRLINQKSTDQQDYHYRYFNVLANFIREK